MDVWKVTASRSGSSLRHRGTSSRVSAGWTTLCLLLLPLAPPFCSECRSESRLFSGALSSSTLGWLGCPPALAMGWTQMVEWVSAELDWSKAAFSLVLPKQASRAEHGKECILPEENFRLSVSLAFHTDMTWSNAWPGSKEKRKSSFRVAFESPFPCLTRRWPAHPHQDGLSTYPCKEAFILGDFTLFLPFLLSVAK